MPIYKQATEITNIDDLLSSVERDIEEVYFGDKNVFTVWAEYDGTLPATYTANGSALADYRVYGAAGGVGDRTVNILPPHFIRGTYEPTGFDPAYGNNAASSDIIHLTTGTYSIIHSQQYATYVITVSDGKRTSVAHSESAKIITFNAVSEADYVVQVNVTPMTDDIVARLESTTMLVEGSTAPAEYVPYGYEVDMSVSDGTTSTTTPIYIGSDPLGEDEYVSFKEQKVYRRTEQLWDGVLYNGHFTSSDFILTDATRPGVYKSIKVLLQPGNYVLKFNPMVYLVRTLINGGYSEYSYNTEEVYFTVNSERYVGFSFRNTSNTKWESYTSTISIKGIYSTDPPVPLPALPTVDGTTITDYAGQSAAPSRFYAKYRKG